MDGRCTFGGEVKCTQNLKRKHWLKWDDNIKIGETETGFDIDIGLLDNSSVLACRLVGLKG
jgi:hypothetical protein